MFMLSHMIATSFTHSEGDRTMKSLTNAERVFRISSAMLAARTLAACEHTKPIEVRRRTNGVEILECSSCATCGAVKFGDLEWQRSLIVVRLVEAMCELADDQDQRDAADAKLIGGASPAESRAGRAAAARARLAVAFGLFTSSAPVLTHEDLYRGIRALYAGERPRAAPMPAKLTAVGDWFLEYCDGPLDAETARTDDAAIAAVAMLDEEGSS
jgi:hypothetical protein